MCWNLDGPSEDARAEIKKNGPRDRPPSSEAERQRREQMNAGERDTAYFSIRYEEGLIVIRGTTPYFLGDVLKARYEELEALYKLFPDDLLLLLHLQSYFGGDWREIKEGLDRERAILAGGADDE